LYTQEEILGYAKSRNLSREDFNRLLEAVGRENIAIAEPVAEAPVMPIVQAPEAPPLFQPPTLPIPREEEAAPPPIPESLTDKLAMEGAASQLEHKQFEDTADEIQALPQFEAEKAPSTAFSLEDQKLQKEERQYYEDHPNLVLTPTGEKTEFGMPIYLDQYKKSPL